MHTDGDLGYAAGLIDGEGTITITRRHSDYGHGRRTTYRVTACVNNTDPGMVLWLREKFGGDILAMRRTVPQAHLYRWTLHGTAADQFLRQILPYLRTKADHARLALVLGDDIVATHRRHLSTEDLSRREALKQQMLVLNGRAHRPLAEFSSASNGTGV